jgi:4-diphosphocytidyl-2-C-methyl-D-erythritol kinase
VDLRKIAAALGADVPVSLVGRPSLIRGRGENLLPAPALPPCHFVLANPGVELSTAEVFARHDGAASDTSALEGTFPDAQALAQALSQRLNDLEPAARALAPAIGETLRLIGATPGCLLARMSGSGATCFGLFENSIDAEAAAEILRQSEPKWWIKATSMNGV